MIALLFVFTVTLLSFSIMSACLRVAEERPMGGIEASIHAMIIGAGLVGSVFAPIVGIPALVSMAFFAPQVW